MTVLNAKELTCSGCKKSFMERYKNQRFAATRYCSPTCKSANQPAKHALQCSRCSKWFNQRYKNQHMRPRYYCSEDCRVEDLDTINKNRSCGMDRFDREIVRLVDMPKPRSDPWARNVDHWDGQ